MCLHYRNAIMSYIAYKQVIISDVRLVYRTRIKASDIIQVKCSKDVFDIFMENWNQDSIEHIQECKLMLLTWSSKVLTIKKFKKKATLI